MNAQQFSQRVLGRPIFWMPIRATAQITAVAVAFYAFIGSAVFLKSGGWPSVARVAGAFNATPEFIPVVWTVLTGFYGLIRTSRYHPTRATGYADWLATTPWRPGMALPAGPPYLVWEDTIPLAAIASYCAHPVFPLTALVVLFAWLGIRATQRTADARWFAAAIIALAATGVLVWPSGFALFIVESVAAAVTNIVLHRSLHELPWRRQMKLTEARQVKARASARWPLAPLSPPAPLAAILGWATALLAGWCVYCVMIANLRADRVEDRGTLVVLPALIILFAPFIRWAKFCGQYQPPISTWGRLWTLRLIVPEYDYVLIAPLSAFAAGVIVAIAGGILGVGLPVSSAVAVFATIAIVLNMGPTLAQWQLTGGHRVVFIKPQNRRRGSTA